MRAARAVLIAEALHVITHLAKTGRRRAAGESAADDDDLKLAAVRRTNESGVILEARPLGLERTGRNFRIERADHNGCAGRTSPNRTAAGIEV